MAISEVGSGSQRQPGSGLSVDSFTIVYPGNVTAGNILVCLIAGWSTGSVDTFAISDTRSTSYGVIQPVTPLAYASGFAGVAIAYGQALSSGSCTVTINPSGTGDYVNAVVDEFASTVGFAADPLSVDGGEDTANNTTPSDALTTLVDPSLILGISIYNAAVGITPGGSYTQIGEDETAAAQTYNAVFRLVTTAQAYTVDWTISPAATWIAKTAAFKETAPAGPAVTLMGVILM